MPIHQLTFEALRYRLASDSGLTTAAGSSVTTTGSMTAGDAALTVAATTSFSAGHGILVTDAGTGGGRLATWIESIAGSVFTLHDQAVNTVSSVAVEHDDRGVVIANNIIPSYGNLPVAFPTIAMRMDGGIGNEFSNSLAGDLYLYTYVQSEPGSVGQPMTILNLICGRIRDLLHKHEEDISNGSIRVQKMWEMFVSGVVPEIDISETTHSQALRYEFMVNVA